MLHPERSRTWSDRDSAGREAEDVMARRESRHRLSAFRLEGFKSLRDLVEIPIRPLTLLAGANNAGEPSVMQPLLLMRQAFEAPFDPGPVLLDGPLVKVEHAKTLFWKGRRTACYAPRA